MKEWNEGQRVADYLLEEFLDQQLIEDPSLVAIMETYKKWYQEGLEPTEKNFLYYEDQKAAAKRRSKDFRETRLPKFLGYFERVLERNRANGALLVGKRVTYADLSMAQVIAGLRYAFPAASRKALRSCPCLRALHDAVFARPRIARYVASRRRLAFNNEGIFRRYRELDG